MFPVTRGAAARPVWALVEQGCISGGNFFLNAALARTLDAATYGCFATAFVCGLFATIIHNGALLDPIAIVGMPKSPALFVDHVAAQVWEHLRLCARLVLLPIGCGILLLTIMREPTLGRALLMSGVTLPAVLMLPLARRILVVSDKHARATLAAGVYAAVVMVGYFALNRYMSVVGIASAYVLLAAASVTGALILAGSCDWRLLGRRVLSSRYRLIQPAQRQQARYLVPASALTFIVMQIQVPTLVWLMGAEHAGLYRAMQLPMTAVGQVIAAASAMALPRLAESFSAGDLTGVARRTRVLVVGLLLICIGAEAALLLGHGAITRAMFGGKFVESSWLMPLIGLVAITSCWGSAFGVALLAMRESRMQFVAARTTAVVGIPLALGLTVVYGVPGAAMSAVLNYLVFSTMNARAYARISRQLSDVESPGALFSAPAAQARG